MNSPIAGQGIFTMSEIPSGTELGMSHIVVDEEIYRTPLGGFINHSDNPNCEKYLIGNKYYICLLYTSPSPRDYAASRMPSSA